MFERIDLPNKAQKSELKSPVNAQNLTFIQQAES